MVLLWTNLAHVHHSLLCCRQPYPQNTASMAAWEVEEEVGNQTFKSSYIITNEAQRKESRPNTSILRQLTALTLALPPGAKHDQSPHVHGLFLHVVHAGVGLPLERDSDHGKDGLRIPCSQPTAR
jgi:hypothetical protein